MEPVKVLKIKALTAFVSGTCSAEAFLAELESDNTEERKATEAQIEYYTAALKPIEQELEAAKDSGDILAVKKARRELEDIKDTIETYKNYLANIQRHLWTKASPEEIMAAYMRHRELRVPEITSIYEELAAHRAAIGELKTELLSLYRRDSKTWNAFYQAAEKPELFFTDPTCKPWDQCLRVATWKDYANIGKSDLYKDLKAFESGESWLDNRGN